jgi:hypothetical protein
MIKKKLLYKRVRIYYYILTLTYLRERERERERMCKVRIPGESHMFKLPCEQGQSCLSEQGARVRAHEALKGSLMMFNKFGIWCISNYASQTSVLCTCERTQAWFTGTKKPMKIRKDYYVLLVCVCVCMCKVAAHV